MTPQNRPSALRSTLSRLAIAGTASLAAVFVVAPVAVADDAPSSEPTEEPTSAATSAETGAEQGTDPAEDKTDAPEDSPAEDSPEEESQPPAAPETEAVVDPAPSPRTGPAEKPTIKAAVEDEEADEIEADFGFQKFRVGVQIADGSYVGPGATTVGSTFQITYTDQDGGKTVDTCTTEPDTDDVETTSYCLGEGEPDLGGLSEKARKAVSAEQDDEYKSEQYFYADPGETVTIKQLTPGPGLAKANDVVTIEPCESSPFLGSNGPCGSGAFPFDFEPTITKVLFDNTGTVKSGTAAVSDSTTTTTTATRTSSALPNTGGPSAELLGLGALMLAGGGALTVRARRRVGVDAG